jgi:hypothetical protein
MKIMLTALLVFYLFAIASGYIVASNCGELAAGLFGTVGEAIERVNK